jgi:hypothetical protein
MPLKLNVGASKKIADNNYGSRGASVNVEMELDSTLVAEPAKLQDKIRQLFGLVRVSLAEELNGGNGSPKPADDNSNGAAPASNGQGSNLPRPATQSQVKAIHAISRSKQVNLGKLLRDRFHVGKPDDLSIKEASSLIDELKNGNGQGGG